MDLSVVQTLGGRVEEDASGGVTENAQDGWHQLSIKEAHYTPTPGFNAWVRSRLGKTKDCPVGTLRPRTWQADDSDVKK